MPQQHQTPYYGGTYGNVGAVGDILQTILAKREADRMAAEAEAYKRYKDQVERGFDERRVSVDEGELGVHQGTLKQNTREWDEDAPGRASVISGRDATTGKTLQETQFGKQDRERIDKYLGELPEFGPEGQLSPRTVFGLEAAGGPKIGTEEGRLATYGPTFMGKQAGLREGAEFDTSGNRIYKAKKDIDTASAIAIDAAEQKGKDAAAGGSAGQGGIQDSYIRERKDRISTAAKDLQDRVSGWTTGWGSLLSYLPATEAGNFESDLSELKSAISFGELTEMRAASKTGGALGSVSEKELALLENALGSLNMKQSGPNFSRNLQKIQDSIDRWHLAYDAEQARKGIGARPRGADVDPMAGLEFNPATNSWVTKGGVGQGGGTATVGGRTTRTKGGRNYTRE